ncbi:MULTISPECIES: hypothetical protein [unclassified Shinella]|uniref:hypothetical protein n=1 Tax=unclassified Shinella TaxID=2643062 RepID=UPI00234EA76E|nr:MULTISPECIES: hypothetical protein [unclassified Shinella]MCO5152837.1 hypothetical protein [Shinella sp.]MDC7260829.1 hypothetical protein [Shinella sp. HY16]MDC7267724.1 hypothetical protein [Shinella sp. YZ44]
MVADFQAFAKQGGLSDCVFWGIGLACAKAESTDLAAALKRFNDRINIEFSELRKTGRFEMLLLVIHPRFDDNSGLFDLHAHFVARVPREHRDDIKHRLRCKFSKYDFPDHAIRNAAAVATYMMWGIFRNKVMISWPDHALRAAWELVECRFQFVRTGGSFAKWRAVKRPAAELSANSVDETLRRRNREETADRRQNVITGDRLLSRIMLTIRGVRMPALLFEVAPQTMHADDQSSRRYSSAVNIVTQEPPKWNKPTGQAQVCGCNTMVWHRLTAALEWITAPISSLAGRIHGIGKKLVRKLRS